MWRTKPHFEINSPENLPKWQRFYMDLIRAKNINAVAVPTFVFRVTVCKIGKGVLCGVGRRPGFVWQNRERETNRSGIHLKDTLSKLVAPVSLTHSICKSLHFETHRELSNVIGSMIYQYLLQWKCWFENKILKTVHSVKNIRLNKIGN